MIITNGNLNFLRAEGEMAELIRAKDWKNTSLGDPVSWPQSLKTMVGMMLDNPFGMYIAWGDDYIQIYNDGYRPILGATKHPHALGISARQTFTEIWNIIGPMFEGVMKGKAVGFPDFMLPLDRNGFVEECYFDFSYSPIRKDDGEVGGILVTVIETTSKKKAAEALKESELRFRTLADNIPNLAWMADAEGWIYWYNKKWYDYTGTTPEQMEGWGWQSVHDPIELPIVMERWKESISTGNAFEMVFPLKGADGRYRYFLTRVLPVKDEIGKIIQWFGSNTDITQQKETEEALKESEQRFRDTVKQAPVGITILRGKNYIVEMANDTYLQLIDRKETEFVGRPLFDSLPEVKESVHALLESVLNTGTPYHGNEVPIPLNRHGKLEMSYFDFLYHPLKENDGEISGILVTVTEVSEKVSARKRIEQSEKKFEAAIHAVQGIIWTNNSKGEMLGEQPGWANLTGQRYEEYQGHGWAKAVHPDDAQPSLDAWNHAVANKNTFVFEHRLHTKQKEWKLFSVKAVPVFDEKGTIHQWVGVHTDITEQREAAQKIKESEERFRIMADAAPNIVWALNPDGTQKYVNKYAVDYLGVSLEETITLNWQPFIHPDDLESTGKGVSEAVQNRTLYSKEHRLLRRDGLYRWFLSQGAPSFFDNGELYGFVGSGIDITERKETEEALAYRTTLLEAHNEASVDGVLLVDAKGKILSFNQRFIEIWNMPQHIVNSNDDNAALSFAMKQLVNPQQFIDKVKYLYENPKETSLDELEFKDGKIIERNGYPVIGENSIYYAWSWTFKDITSKKKYENKIKESEERFRSLAQTLPHLIWITDAEGNFEFTSDRWLAYTGIKNKSPDEWKAIVHPDDYENSNAAWMQSLTTGNNYTSDVRLKNKNGEYRWHTVIGEPVLDERNNIIKWVGAFTDTHSEKLFMQELELKVKERTNDLEQFNIELERNNKELEAFAYISSHDLQEPLRKIQTFAERIIEKEHESLSEHGKDLFKRIQNAGNRMQNLIQDLLVYSKTKTPERNYENTSLNTIIDEVKEDLSEEIEAKSATIESTELCHVKIIPFQFRQLMHNLIGNALKFSNPDIPPHIKIKSKIAKGITFNNEKLNPQNTYCKITISDNGIGFDQQYNQKIFEVFQRLHGRNQYEGTGIGLAIVKKIVENHEGIITASSELNKGATFEIYIPAK